MKKIQFAVLLIIAISHTGLCAQGLRIYTSQEPPLNFSKTLDEDVFYSDDVTGLATDFVREIIKRTKTDAKIELVPWARAYMYAQKEKNVVVYSMVRLEQRENLFHWVGPIALKKAMLFAKKNSGIKINSLEGVKRVGTIGTLRQDAKELFLRKRGVENIQNFDSWGKGLKQLVSGGIDLWTQTDFDVQVVAKRTGIDVHEIEPVLTLYNTPIYIGMSKSTSKQIVQRWQGALDDMKADGTYEGIVNKWKDHYKSNWIVKDGMVQINYE